MATAPDPKLAQRGSLFDVAQVLKFNARQLIFRGFRSISSHVLPDGLMTKINERAANEAALKIPPIEDKKERLTFTSSDRLG